MHCSIVIFVFAAQGSNCLYAILFNFHLWCFQVCYQPFMNARDSLQATGGTAPTQILIYPVDIHSQIEVKYNYTTVTDAMLPSLSLIITVLIMCVSFLCYALCSTISAMRLLCGSEKTKSQKLEKQTNTTTCEKMKDIFL